MKKRKEKTEQNVFWYNLWERSDYRVRFRLQRAITKYTSGTSKILNALSSLTYTFKLRERQQINITFTLNLVYYPSFVALLPPTYFKVLSISIRIEFCLYFSTKVVWMNVFWNGMKYDYIWQNQKKGPVSLSKFQSELPYSVVKLPPEKQF